MRRVVRPVLLASIAASLLGSCGAGAGGGDPLQVTVPNGAAFAQVADSLAHHDIIGNAFLFELYARLRGATHSIKPGTYEFRRGAAWSRILHHLRAGTVLTRRLVVPEGWDLVRIAPRLADITGLDSDTVLRILAGEQAASRFGVPGPTLEGYLYPATYTIAVGVSLDSVLEEMVAAYRLVWNAERRARADTLGFSEREVVTLASIVEREAMVSEELPTIAAVYHNRLRIGMALQADPTVQYALGSNRPRLLYAHIDSVADHPYNTYSHPGLPPGPIGSPSESAIDAVLHPDSAQYLYFVARPDGSHVFTRSLAEHNRAKAAIRRAQRDAAKP